MVGIIKCHNVLGVFIYLECGCLAAMLPRELLLTFFYHQPP
jgi:hypothetical protein